jgi:uncharacterized protein YukE
MEVKIIHEVRFGKDGCLDGLIFDFLEGYIINKNSIIQKLDQIMANQKDFQDAFKRIDDATSSIATGISSAAAKISGLEDKIKALGLDASQEADILSHVQGIAPVLEQAASSLEQIAKDPENPVPVDPVTTTTTTQTPTTTTTTQAPIDDTSTEMSTGPGPGE